LKPKTNPQADDATLLALHEAGKSQEEIAQMIGNVHRSTISRRLKQLTPRKSTEIFKIHRADILAEFQRKIMSACTSAEIKKMVASRGMTDFGILYDKEQIERGHGADARPMVMIQINTGKPEPVDKTVDNLIPNHINTIEVR